MKAGQESQMNISGKRKSGFCIYVLYVNLTKAILFSNTSVSTFAMKTLKRIMFKKNAFKSKIT